MVRSYSRLMIIACLGSCLAPLAPVLPGRVERGLALAPDFLFKVLLVVCAAAVVTVAFRHLVKKLEPLIDANAREQAGFLDALSVRYVDLAIVGAAALSLFLELAIIRWQGTVFEFFAFYKNFGLLSCFVGLGLGYALASRDRISLILTIPLLAWQFGFMVVLRFGLGTWGLQNLRVLPFREQLHMGLRPVDFAAGFSIYFLLAVVFLITTLAFIPIGQLCGRLMERRTKLKAYGLNLLGSLLGVVLMLLASALWTPPLIWFVLCFVCILLFHLRTSVSLLLGIGASLACTVILAWPVEPLWHRIYSPYQMLELGTNEDNGLMLIRAAGYYYQRVYDFSGSRISPKLEKTRQYYEFPYRANPQLENVAIVGAGSGNDVAAALRSGARHVDAIEIDPAILMAGKANHPEKPYSDPRVRAVVNDARSFLRTTTSTYDLIVYGLLDSHTLLSQASSVRLDSFVYTVEGLREARSRLKKDTGVLSLSFAVLNQALGRKIYMMMEQAFDGRPPKCVVAGYDGSVIFMESNNTDWVLSASLLEQTGFQDRTPDFADPAIRADVSTDDWPFFYMPRRVYPASYLFMVCQVLVMSAFVTGSFFSEKPRFSHLSFFCLGVGFMLVETKGITEMGLTFGNTWQVIGIVIASILVMAFLANLVVQRLNIRRPAIPYLLLCTSLLVGWSIARSGGLPSTPFGRLETAIMLTCPLFFSGIVFSTLLSSKGQLAGVMAINLLGAVCGGLLEYNSMYFGFQSLYLIAIFFYVAAFVFDMATARRGAQSHLPSAVEELS
jgi:hypothetical protein